MKNEMSVPAPDSTREAGSRAVEVRGRSGYGLGQLALLVAVAALAVQFHLPILNGFRSILGPQPWISAVEQALSPTQAMPEALPAIAEGQSYEGGETTAEMAELSALAFDLRRSVEQLEEAFASSVKADDLASLQSRLDAVTQAQIAQSDQAAKQAMEIAASVADLKKRLSVAQPSPLASLLVARIALVNANRTLSTAEVDQLAMAVSMDPVLSELVATLKVLAGQEIHSLSALRERFAAERDEAVAIARSAQLQWWESGLTSAQSTMAEWGLSRPVKGGKDDLVVNEAMRLLDLNDLRGALLQLEAASPELRSALASWLDQAHLRQSFDETLLQLVDALISRNGMQAVAVPANGG